MKYTLSGEDEKVFKVKHPDGSEFHIAKNAIGPEIHKRIKALKMADGGEVPEVDEVGQDEPEPQEVDRGLAVEPVSEQESQEVLPEQDQSILSPQLEAPQPSVSQAYEQAFAQKKQGVQELAQAQAQAAKEQSQAYEQQVNQVQKAQADYQAQHAAIDTEHKQLIGAIMQDKVDANRLFHNMGTGNKVLAAISVALSGLGSGLTGQPNMAMGVIQKAIDRDIESQRLELGKKHTLLSDNVRRYGDLNTATQMTQLQMNAITQAKIAQAAMKSGSAQAQAQAKVLLSDIDLQAAQLKQQLSLAQAKAQSYGLGGGEGGLPLNQEPFQLLSDPKYQEKRVIVNGRAYQHTGDKGAAQDFRNVESVAGGVTNLVRQLDELGADATVPGTEANNKAQAIRYQLSTEIPKLKSMQIGAKRVNETEAERAEEMVSNPTSFKQLVNGGVRNQVFFKTLEDELERARQDNLIGYKGKAQYKSFKPGV